LTTNNNFSKRQQRGYLLGRYDCLILDVYRADLHVVVSFYPRDATLARVIAIATCQSVCPSRAGIVSKRRKLAA